MRGWKITHNSDGRPVREGDSLTVDSNLPVTFVRIASEPWGDDEAGKWYPGTIRVRYAWGAEESVAETRAGVTISEI